MEKFGKFILGLIFFVIGIVVEGFCLVYMWQWFINPLTNISLDFWHAVGLSMAVSCFVGMKSSQNKDDEYFETLLRPTVYYLMFWGLGFIVHLFV